MKKYRWEHVLLLFCAIISVGLLVGCKAQNTTSSGRTVPEETDLSVNTDTTQSKFFTVPSELVTVADFAKSYDTVEKLGDDASSIIAGTVKSTYQHTHEVAGDTVPYTLFEVEVTKVLKGAVKLGSVVTVAEYGGILTAAQLGLDKKFPQMAQADKDAEIHVSFGNEAAKAGQQLLLFLSDGEGYQILNIDQPYYMLVGEYHGKLLYDGKDSYVQALPAQADMTLQLSVGDDFSELG